jgi:nucleolin
MGKVKQANGKAAKAADPLTAVKKAGVTKATDSPKAKSKQLAKDVATKAVLNGKAKDLKKKKVESSSESEASSDESEAESESEASESGSDSDSSDSEEETKKKTTKAVAKATTNGKAKKVVEPESESSDSSDSEEEVADTKKGGAKVQADVGQLITTGYKR